MAAARAGDVHRARSLIHSWIEDEPSRQGDAWHPYPLATRAGNWLAALSLEPELVGGPLPDSLWQQLEYLRRNVEDDILGNHVIRNARALVLGGAAFGDAELLERGRALLERELPEQVLSDGGHYERSPVYHLVVLRDLLEVEPWADVAAFVERMRRFAAALVRPDGKPWLFNDGTLDLAPALELPAPPAGLSVFPETGYAVLRTDRLWLAFDCGPPSPPFLPAHAHADALSFQLWVDGAPLVVDPGMPTYEAGAERDRYRGTRAHSTVAVDGDQFELWGAFRSGPLPQVGLLRAEPELLEGEVRFRGLRHLRRIAIDAAELVVTDVVEGAGERELESSLPLASVADSSRISSSGDAELEQRAIAERLNVREPAPALVQRLRARPPVELGWRVGL